MRKITACLEGLITTQEAHSALKQTKNDKSPGSDGYTTTFVKFFFVDLGSLMVRSVNHGFCKGKMSVTQRQGIITCVYLKRERGDNNMCIPKEGKRG